MQEFSLASVILSYFLVGGGLFAGTLAVWLLKLDSRYVGYAMMAGGSAVGGFIAARASRGSTVIEPALGAVAVVATVVGLAARTALGHMIWNVDQGQSMRFVALVGASSAGGAIVGAFVSEKLFGEATLSAAPWLLYSAFAVFGACLIATIVAMFLGGDDQGAAVSRLGMMLLIGMAAGAVLAGLAVGASARTRPLLASLIGGGLGVAGFFALLAKANPQILAVKDAMLGLVALAIGGALATLIGTALGWAAIGRRHAG